MNVKIPRPDQLVRDQKVELFDVKFAEKLVRKITERLTKEYVPDGTVTVDFGERLSDKMKEHLSKRFRAHGWLLSFTDTKADTTYVDVVENNKILVR